MFVSNNFGKEDVKLIADTVKLSSNVFELQKSGGLIDRLNAAVATKTDDLSVFELIFLFVIGVRCFNDEILKKFLKIFSERMLDVFKFQKISERPFLSQLEIIKSLKIIALCMQIRNAINRFSDGMQKEKGPLENFPAKIPKKICKDPQDFSSINGYGEQIISCYNYLRECEEYYFGKCNDEEKLVVLKYSSNLFQRSFKYSKQNIKSSEEKQYFALRETITNLRANVICNNKKLLEHINNVVDGKTELEKNTFQDFCAYTFFRHYKKLDIGPIFFEQIGRVIENNDLVDYDRLLALTMVANMLCWLFLAKELTDDLRSRFHFYYKKLLLNAQNNIVDSEWLNYPIEDGPAIGMTHLRIAVLLRMTETIKLLYAHGANPFFVPVVSNLAEDDSLSAVCKEGSVELVQLFLSGRDLNRDLVFERSLFAAIEGRNYRVLELVLACKNEKFNVNRIYKKIGNLLFTPIGYAANENKLEMVRLLLNHSTEVNKTFQWVGMDMSMTQKEPVENSFRTATRNIFVTFSALWELTINCFAYKEAKNYANFLCGSPSFCGDYILDDDEIRVCLATLIKLIAIREIKPEEVVFSFENQEEVNFLLKNPFFSDSFQSELKKRGINPIVTIDISTTYPIITIELYNTKESPRLKFISILESLDVAIKLFKKEQKIKEVILDEEEKKKKVKHFFDNTIGYLKDNPQDEYQWIRELSVCALSIDLNDGWSEEKEKVLFLAGKFINEVFLRFKDQIELALPAIKPYMQIWNYVVGPVDCKDPEKSAHKEKVKFLNNPVCLEHVSATHFELHEHALNLLFTRDIQCEHKANQFNKDFFCGEMLSSYNKSKISNVSSYEEQHVIACKFYEQKLRDEKIKVYLQKPVSSGEALGLTLVAIAVITGNLPLLKLLDQHGFSLQQKVATGRKQGYTLLMLACEEHHLTVVQFLLGKEIDPNQIDAMNAALKLLASADMHPLSENAYNQSFAIVCELVKHGARVDAITSKKETGMNYWIFWTNILVDLAKNTIDVSDKLKYLICARSVYQKVLANFFEYLSDRDAIKLLDISKNILEHSYMLYMMNNKNACDRATQVMKNNEVLSDDIFLVFCYKILIMSLNYQEKSPVQYFKQFADYVDSMSSQWMKINRKVALDTLGNFVYILGNNAQDNLTEDRMHLIINCYTKLCSVSCASEIDFVSENDQVVVDGCASGISHAVLLTRAKLPKVAAAIHENGIRLDAKSIHPNFMGNDAITVACKMGLLEAVKLYIEAMGENFKFSFLYLYDVIESGDTAVFRHLLSIQTNGSFNYMGGVNGIQLNLVAYAAFKGQSAMVELMLATNKPMTIERSFHTKNFIKPIDTDKNILKTLLLLLENYIKNKDFSMAKKYEFLIGSMQHLSEDNKAFLKKSLQTIFLNTLLHENIQEQLKIADLSVDASEERIIFSCKHYADAKRLQEAYKKIDSTFEVGNKKSNSSHCVTVRFILENNDTCLLNVVAILSKLSKVVGECLLRAQDLQQSAESVAQVTSMLLMQSKKQSVNETFSAMNKDNQVSVVNFVANKVKSKWKKTSKSHLQPVSEKNWRYYVDMKEVEPVKNLSQQSAEIKEETHCQMKPLSLYEDKRHEEQKVIAIFRKKEEGKENQKLNLADDDRLALEAIEDSLLRISSLMAEYSHGKKTDNDIDKNIFYNGLLVNLIRTFEALAQRIENKPSHHSLTINDSLARNIRNRLIHRFVSIDSENFVNMADELIANLLPTVQKYLLRKKIPDVNSVVDLSNGIFKKIINESTKDVEDLDFNMAIDAIQKQFAMIKGFMKTLEGKRDLELHSQLIDASKMSLVIVGEINAYSLRMWDAIFKNYSIYIFPTLKKFLNDTTCLRNDVCHKLKMVKEKSNDNEIFSKDFNMHIVDRVKNLMRSTDKMSDLVVNYANRVNSEIEKEQALSFPRLPQSILAL